MLGQIPKMDDSGAYTTWPGDADAGAFAATTEYTGRV